MKLTTNSSVQEAWLAARDSDEDVDFDYDSQNPHFSYLDEHELRHDVWFLDAASAWNEMRAAQALGIQTFALWRLGPKTVPCGGFGICPAKPPQPTN